ncbi:MAG: bifunctional YncE family protein/alkaline phosphatase family protein [Gemmatimonadaceae bacterium]
MRSSTRNRKGDALSIFGGAVCVVACVSTLACGSGAPKSASAPSEVGTQPVSEHRLPTGVRLDPVGRSIPVGNMPIAALASPDGRYLVLSLAGWRDQGIDIVDLASGRVAQHTPQTGAFLGLAWSADGRTLYVSGGAADAVYEYQWQPAAPHPASLVDSISVGHADATTPGSRYPAGIALSADGKSLYVAENLSDSLAVLDLATRRVVQRVAVGSYPYAVVATHDSSGSHVYVSAWGASSVATFRVSANGRLFAEQSIEVGRHPSAMVASADGSRLFVASASTDRVAVVDTRARRVLRWLLDQPPGGVAEGSTPNALALSADGKRLLVAEADANAIAVFALSGQASGTASGADIDSLLGRIPTEWYPTAVGVHGDSLWVVNGKGRGAGPNPNGPQPNRPLAQTDPHSYTLGQLSGTVSAIGEVHGNDLDALSRRVARANGWDTTRVARAHYPPFEHVVYIIKENRTYDQVLGDLPQADGDTTLLFFPRAISPNHHALAERFGIFDRFFVNAEVSNQGHPWSTAAYVTDFLEKTTPDDYRGSRPEHDDAAIDASDPAMGYLWDAAIKKGLSLRVYGEYAELVPRAANDTGPQRVRSLIPSLAPYTNPTYPPFDMTISDQVRADAWLAEFARYERSGKMPALEILHLPRDHTAGARATAPTPKAYMADNDFALGRIIEALSRSPFWKHTLVFVVEDDAQAGPDHVDSHRSVMLAMSAWNRGGVIHRFVNTTDVLATIEEVLGLDPMSHFDRFGRPLRDIWRDTPDLRAYVALESVQSRTELNLATGTGARRSARLDFSEADKIDDEQFNHILWRAIKGPGVPYPGAKRAAVQEYVRGN